MKPKTRTLTSDLSGVNAGRARLAGDEQSQQERAANQRDAWAYLNRRYPPEQAAELADILGVAPDAHRNRLSQLVVNSPEPPLHRATGTHTVPRSRQQDAGGTGRCRACDRTYRLRGDRRLRPHPAWETRDGARLRLPWDCDGSGLRPEDVEAA